MEYVQMTINDWLEVKHKLKMELQGVKQSFVRIGYVLRKIDDQKLYENDGYKSIAEFAKEEYGLEASTVSRFMSINREYSIDGYSEHLREEYLEMGRSQLEEMLKLPDKDREMIHPETSREQIRELKRFNKSEPAAGVADDVVKLIEKFYEDNPDVLNGVFSEETDFQDTLERKIEIVNPSGNRSYKKGLFFLMMYEDSIKIKKFGSDPQTMSWSEFFDITVMIFGEVAAGPKTWKNYFGGEDETGNGAGGDDNSSDNDGRTTPEDNATTNNADRQGENDAREDENTGRVTKSIPGSNREKPENNTEKEEIETNDTGRDDDEPEENSEGGSSPEPGENTVAASETEPKKEEIAPAQKVDLNSVRTECEEVLEEEKTEQIPGQMVVEDYPELMPERLAEQMNPPVEGAYTTRKAYLDSLTEYGAAEYMAQVFRENKGPANQLFASGWEQWFAVKVDERGREIE